MADDEMFDDEIDEIDDPIDARLIAALQDAFEDDPIPADLSQFAIDALRWRVVDDDLAALTFDSSTSELVGIRGTATQRRALRFEGLGLVVSVSVSDAALVASIEPPAVYECLVEGPHMVVVVRSDDNGELAVDECSPPVRLVVETPAGRFVTPWITA